MMGKEIRAELRGKCKSAGWSIQNGQVAALLDETDEKDAEIERLRARCEALERAIIEAGEFERFYELAPCTACVNRRTKHDVEPCNGCLESDNYPSWMFDQARFEGGDD